MTDNNAPVPEAQHRCLIEALRRIELGTSDATDASSIRCAFEGATGIINDLRQRIHVLENLLKARLN